MKSYDYPSLRFWEILFLLVSLCFMLLAYLYYIDE